MLAHSLHLTDVKRLDAYKKRFMQEEGSTEGEGRSTRGKGTRSTKGEGRLTNGEGKSTELEGK